MRIFLIVLFLALTVPVDAQSVIAYATYGTKPPATQAITRNYLATFWSAQPLNRGESPAVDQIPASVAFDPPQELAGYRLGFWTQYIPTRRYANIILVDNSRIVFIAPSSTYNPLSSWCNAAICDGGMSIGIVRVNWVLERFNASNQWEDWQSGSVDIADGAAPAPIEAASDRQLDWRTPTITVPFATMRQVSSNGIKGEALPLSTDGTLERLNFINAGLADSVELKIYTYDWAHPLYVPALITGVLSLTDGNKTYRLNSTRAERDAKQQWLVAYTFNINSAFYLQLPATARAAWHTTRWQFSVGGTNNPSCAQLRLPLTFAAPLPQLNTVAPRQRTLGTTAPNAAPIRNR